VVALREIADGAVLPDEVRDSLVSLYQDVQPTARAEDEQDRLALTAPVESSEEDVLRALQAEAEAQRDERY
jgi:DNA-directed RNA polymerase subunit omega